MQVFHYGMGAGKNVMSDSKTGTKRCVKGGFEMAQGETGSPGTSRFMALPD
jgi:hypothetical protein